MDRYKTILYTHRLAANSSSLIGPSAAPEQAAAVVNGDPRIADEHEQPAVAAAVIEGAVTASSSEQTQAAAAIVPDAAIAAFEPQVNLDHDNYKHSAFSFIVLAKS